MSCVLIFLKIQGCFIFFFKKMKVWLKWTAKKRKKAWSSGSRGFETCTCYLLFFNAWVSNPGITVIQLHTENIVDWESEALNCWWKLYGHMFGETFAWFFAKLISGYVEHLLWQLRLFNMQSILKLKKAYKRTTFFTELSNAVTTETTWYGPSINLLSFLFLSNS